MKRFLKKVMSVLAAAILVLGALSMPGQGAVRQSAVYAEVLADPYFSGEGTELNPFLISSAAHMVQLALLVNAGDIAYKDKYYKMINDIDMTSVTDWIPVGNATFAGFEGIFDGDGYSILNLTVDQEAATLEYAFPMGVFGSNFGTIMNLTVAESYFYFYGDCNIFIGGIVGYNSGNISNCINSCTIISDHFSTIGGISGVNGGVIADCFNEGDLSGIEIEYYTEKMNGVEGNIGGIAGINNGEITISGCYNVGYLEGLLGNIGGITGKNQYSATISGCFNDGTVTGSQSDIGGIAGVNESADINASANGGYIYGTDSIVAGIAAVVIYGNIWESFNIGYIDTYSVAADSVLGGVAGKISDSSVISNCYNTGFIYGSEAVSAGGIAAIATESEISNSYNAGIVVIDTPDMNYQTGGIVGFNNVGTLRNCYNIGPVYGDYRTGGITGTNNGSHYSCYFLDGNELGIGSGNSSANVISCSVSEMKIPGTYTGFDFTSVWELTPPSQYPQLRTASRVQSIVTYIEKVDTVYFIDVAYPDYPITEIEPPTKEGSNFLGWCTDIACTQLYSFDTPAENDITLYAKWSVSTFTITFDKNGGTTEANPRTKTVNANTATALPATSPTRTGYTFAGWNTAANGGGTAFTSSTLVTANITVYAQWVQIPVSLKAAADTGTSLKITWTAATGVTGYEVYRSTSSTGSYTLAGTVAASAASFISTGLSAGTTYYYKIRAYRLSGGIKLYSAYTPVVSCKVIPPTVTGLAAASASYTSIKLTWTAAAGATGYQVYRATSSTGTYTLLATATTNTYTNTGLATGSTYYYKIMSLTMAGTTLVKAAAYSAVVSCKATPLPVSGLKAASATYSSVKLTWTAVSGATGYQVYRAASTNGTYTLIGTTAVAYYTNTGLATGTTYYYKVMSYRTVGTTMVKAAAYSAVVSCKVTPPAVSGLKAASASYNSIKLTWTAATGASGYLVYRASSSTGTYALVGTVATAYFTNTGLTTGTTYYYKVMTYRTVGTTKVTAVSYSAIVNAKPVPATISSLTVIKVSTTSKKISWGAITGASGYEIYRATSSTGTYTLVTSTTALTYTNTGLVSGKVYYYKVRAYRTVGTTKVYGAFSVVKSA